MVCGFFARLMLCNREKVMGVFVVNHMKENVPKVCWSMLYDIILNRSILHHKCELK